MFFKVFMIFTGLEFASEWMFRDAVAGMTPSRPQSYQDFAEYNVAAWQWHGSLALTRVLPA